MTLAVAIDYRPALLGQSGIGRVARELARALAARGEVDLRLFGHSLARARTVASVPRGARLHRLPVPGRALPLLRALGLGADRLAGRSAVFHWTDYVYPPLSRARAVLTVHDLAFARNPAFHGTAQAEELLARTRAAAAAAAAIAVPSQATAADVRTYLPGAGPVRVIPWGCDHVPVGLHQSAHPFGGRPFALALGTIEPRKNHRALLQAWRQLPEPRPLLVIAGARGWECEQTVQELRAAEGTLLRWFERPPDAWVFALMAHAALVVYPSSWEGFGFPVLEAMALGIPVVAGDCPALRELGERAVVLCNGEDPAAVAAAVQCVLADEALRRRLQIEGPRRARRFTWDACASAHEALYREVAG